MSGAEGLEESGRRLSLAALPGSTPTQLFSPRELCSTRGRTQAASCKACATAL